MSTLKVTNIEHESTTDGGIQLDNSGHVTIDGVQLPTTGALGNRNLIINGAMQVAQRTTASQTQTAGGSVFGVDRFYAYATQASKVTVQQNQASVTPPVGFQKYLGITSSSAYTSLSTDVFSFGQVIEAQNAAQLAWGTSDAKAITLSFWVRSSLTGTHSGAIMNGSFNRSYPYSYTISSADTWEYKTITVPGDTSGTWTMVGNGKFGYIIWDYGTGSDKRGTAGAWTGSQREGVTGAVQLVGTNNATWYITGIQLEVGEKATPFEHRHFSEEFAKCQRYFQTSFDSNPSTTNTDNKGVAFAGGGTTGNTTSFIGGCYVQFAPTMRTAPTITIYDLANPRNTGKVHRHTYGSAGSNNSSGVITDTNTRSFIVRSDSGANASGIIFQWKAECEL